MRRQPRLKPIPRPEPLDNKQKAHLRDLSATLRSLQAAPRPAVRS